MLKRGDIIGQQSFFSDNPKSLHAMSKDYSSLLYVDKDNFLKIIKQFPNDYEKFCHLSDKLVIYND